MSGFDVILEWSESLIKQLPTINFRDVIEIIIISFGIYQIISWLRGTRAWVLFKGLLVIFVLAIVATIFRLDTILWIITKAINVGIIAVIILFQPELRSALESLGRGKVFSTLFNSKSGSEYYHMSVSTVDEIVDATMDMARHKTGALIVIEKDVKLNDHASTGIDLDAFVSSQLLVNIFEHNTPLHDGAVIIRNERIIAATCYLPLSENYSISKELGTRHRAGIGISEVADCLVIIVSEETGYVSLAKNGNVIRNISKEYLREKLIGNAKTQTVRDFKPLSILKGIHKNDE